MYYDPFLEKLPPPPPNSSDSGININQPSSEKRFQNYDQKEIKVLLHGRYRYDSIYREEDDLYPPLEIDTKCSHEPGNTAEDRTDNAEQAKISEYVYNSDPEGIKYMKTRKQSIIHEYVEDRMALFVSFDIKTGGDDFGSLQISAECFTLDSNSTNGGKRRLLNTFDSYVKPHQSSIWSHRETSIYELHRGSSFNY